MVIRNLKLEDFDDVNNLFYAVAQLGNGTAS